MISKRGEKKECKIRVGSNPISIAAIGCVRYPNQPGRSYPVSLKSEIIIHK